MVNRVVNNRVTSRAARRSLVHRAMVNRVVNSRLASRAAGRESLSQHKRRKKNTSTPNIARHNPRLTLCVVTRSLTLRATGRGGGVSAVWIAAYMLAWRVIIPFLASAGPFEVFTSRPLSASCGLDLYLPSPPPPHSPLPQIVWTDQAN